MKNRLLISFTFILFALSALAKDITINYPAYDFTTSGITHITKIELKKSETRIHIHSTFIPHWWVMFSTDTFIEDAETGKQWKVTGIENGEFDKEIYMPASGNSTFVLIFPPIDKKVKKINYREKEETTIYGVSLNPKEKQKQHSKEIPQAVSEWVAQELAKAKRHTPLNLDKDEFFFNDTAHIVGYIKGYTPQAGFNTGIVYAENVLTGEQVPTVIEIYEDGRFECSYPLSHPKSGHLSFNRYIVDYYIEPGHTLAIYLDWDDFLQADRYRDRKYIFIYTEFDGPLARINKEISHIEKELNDIDHRHFYSEGMQRSPETFITYVNSITTPYFDGLKTVLADSSLHPTTLAYFTANKALKRPFLLLEYDMRNKGNTLPSDYFKSIQSTSLNHHNILLNREFDFFINRFEYCSPLSAAYKISPPLTIEKTFEQYLFDELKLEKTSEDEADIQKTNALYKENMTQEEQMECIAIAQKIKERYPIEFNQYTEKYIKPVNTQYNIYLWQAKDSIYAQLNWDANLTYEIAKVRSLNYAFDGMNKEGGLKLLNQLKKTIHTPFLRSEAEQVFSKKYPINIGEAYELPLNEKGTKIFKEIIDPHKGKYILVDFWATTCPPCIQGIKDTKALRHSYKDHPEVAFVFITSNKETPQSGYNKFVQEQELINTHYLSNDEYVYLRQLFHFNGIPRYVLINKDGNVIDDDFRISLLESTIQKLLEGN